MKKNPSPIVTVFVFAWLLLVTAGCSAPWGRSDNDSHHIPHVAIAPVKVGCQSPTPWDLGDEMNFFLEKELSQSSGLRLSTSTFLRAHQRVPAPALWRGKNLTAVRSLLPHDFVILVEMTEYSFIQDKSAGLTRAVNGAKQTKPFLYEVQAYVRVLDLTAPTPKLTLQEEFRFHIPVSLGQVQTDQTLKHWTDRGYFSGAHAAVAAKASSVIAKRLESAIQSAWSRRLPISRYPRTIHSKL